MGYRSDIAIVLRESDFDDMKELIDKAEFDTEWLNRLVKHAARWKTPDETYVLMRDEWVKYYDDYDDVAFLNNFMADHRHAFMRIGEEDGDVEYDILDEDADGCDGEFNEILFLERKIIVSGMFSDNSEILNFIDKISNDGTKEVFLRGCCYWFAFMLSERFKDSNPTVMYDMVENHFGTEINGRIYDVTGDVTEMYEWEPWENVGDTLLRKRIERDCINI